MFTNIIFECVSSFNIRSHPVYIIHFSHTCHLDVFEQDIIYHSTLYTLFISPHHVSPHYLLLPRFFLSFLNFFVTPCSKNLGDVQMHRISHGLTYTYLICTLYLNLTVQHKIGAIEQLSLSLLLTKIR